MTNEEILEKQVEALEKLLQLRAALIEELEAKVSKLNSDLSNARLQWPGTTTPWISPLTPIAPHNPWIPGPTWGGTGTIVISNNCPDGTPHQYPSTWGGTGPIPCTKCGASQNPWNQNITLTGISTTGLALNSDGTPKVHTTGYLQVADGHRGEPIRDNENIFALNRITK